MMFLFIMSSKLGLPASLFVAQSFQYKAGAHPEMDNKIKLSIKYHLTLSLSN